MYINPAREQRQIAISGSLKLAIIICIAFVVGMGAFPNPPPRGPSGPTGDVAAK